MMGSYSNCTFRAFTWFRCLSRNLDKLACHRKEFLMRNQFCCRNTSQAHRLELWFQVLKIQRAIFRVDDRVADFLFRPLCLEPNIWSCAIHDIPMLLPGLETSDAIAMFVDRIAIGLCNSYLTAGKNRSLPKSKRVIGFVSLCTQNSYSTLDAYRFIRVETVIDNAIFFGMVLRQ